MGSLLHAEDGQYFCFFEAQDRPFDQGGHEAFGLATSRDGRHWQKRDGNPIVHVGATGAWDGLVAKLPAGVIKRDNLDHLFYSGLDKRSKQIGLATAQQLAGPWTKAAINPVLRSRPGEWDAFLSTYPTPVFEVGSEYYLLFRGMETRYHRQGTGLAVSRDLRRWRRCMDRPVIAVTEEIASLAVARAGGRYVGISQPKDLQKRRYWFATDLQRWQEGSTREIPRVGTCRDSLKSVSRQRPLDGALRAERSDLPRRTPSNPVSVPVVPSHVSSNHPA